MIPKYFIDRVEAIKKNNRDGATFLTKQAVKIIQDYLTHIYSKKEKLSTHEFINLITHIFRAQPSMASIFQLCNNILLKVDSSNEEELINQINKYYIDLVHINDIYSITVNFHK